MKCKRCGTPIYIDEQTDAADDLAAAVLPPVPPEAPAAGESEADPVQVTCSNCNSRFRVPGATLQRAGIRFKCSQCGNVFAPPGTDLPSVSSPVPSAPTPDFYPGSSTDDPERPMAAMDQDMPLPDEEQLDSLFDDVGEGEDAREPEPFESAPVTAIGADTADGAEIDAEQAYQEATAIYNDGESPPRPPERGTVPDDQKYQIFMKPGDAGGMDSEQFYETVNESADQSAQDAPAMIDPGDLPPDPTATETTADPGAEADAGGLAVALLPAIPDDLGLPSFPRADDSGERKMDPVSGQDANSPEERRTQWIIAAAIVAVLALGGAWVYGLMATDDSDQPYSVQQGEEHRLSFTGKLAGQYLVNKPSGKRLFVVQGILVNRFEQGQTVSWVRLKGRALANKNDDKPLQTAHSYIGNVLTPDQIQKWKLRKIKAFHGYNNGRNDSNFEIEGNHEVPFQLVFTGIESPVRRTIVQVASYSKAGRQVFIDLR